MRCADFRGRCRAGVLGLALLSCLLQAGCGGGGGDGGKPAPPVLTNFQPITVEGGPTGGVNLLFTSVTICSPGDDTDCSTIDHVLVDTASTGFRVLASVLPPRLRLVQQVAASGAALVECTQFADGYSWGPVKTADVRLGGETVRSIPMQVIGDPDFSIVPSACSASGPSENTVREFGSNGILGIGSFINDCGEACVTDAIPGTYYACSAAGCTPTQVPADKQVRHPVSQLTKNNNGVLIRLPAVPPAGAVRVDGTMIFGIGTEANNGLGATRVYTLDPFTATLSVTANGMLYPGSFIDSGSNGIFFPSNDIPVCSSGFYCPAAARTIDVVLQGTNGNAAPAAFTITNADALFASNPTFAAFPTLGAPDFGFGTFDFGLPFFFGRTVFTAIEGRPTPGGPGPFVAF